MAKGLGLKSYEIVILEWEKYQGEGKKWGSTAWLRQVNTEYEHALWDFLDDAEYRAWCFLKQYVSRKSHLSGKIVIPVELAQRLAKVKPKSFLSALKKLASPGLKIVRYSEFTPSEQGESSEQPPSEQDANSELRNDHDTITERNDHDHATETPPSSAVATLIHPIVDVWNECAGEKLPKVVQLPDSNQITRLRECWRQNHDRDYWRALFTRVAKIPFLVDGGDTDWKGADLDWVLKPGSLKKIIAGFYDKKKRGNQALYDDLMAEEGT